jgi:hypothetical protein
MLLASSLAVMMIIQSISQLQMLLMSNYYSHLEKVASQMPVRLAEQ